MEWIKKGWWVFCFIGCCDKIWWLKQLKKQIVCFGLQFHHGRKSMIWEHDYLILWPNSQKAQRAGFGTGYKNLKAFPEWSTSYSKTPPSSGLVTVTNSITSWQLCVQKHEAMNVIRPLEPQQCMWSCICLFWIILFTYCLRKSIRRIHLHNVAWSLLNKTMS